MLLAVLALSSAPTFAAADAGHAATAASAKPTAQADASADRKYCIASDETTTGTKIITRECHTKAEWAKRGVVIDELKKAQ
jgi:hypothetical protein